MSLALREVAVLRQGDTQGNRMVVRLTTHWGAIIHAVSVAQDWPSRTGPTWTYLLDGEGLTLIDAGAIGSFPSLVDGITHAGFRPRDIERVIVTHGHPDHDGAVAQLVGEADTEVWAHAIYAHLLPYDPWAIQRRPLSPIQREMHQVAEADTAARISVGSNDSLRHRSGHDEYLKVRKGLEVDHRIKAAGRLGNLAFLHTPGHSPDEICVTLDGLVFTGDHVLPEITPHPTTKIQYADDVKKALPPEYHDEERFYGLATYLRSLRRIVDLGSDILVLPAHRLFNRNRFNIESVSRAGEVVQHHARRLKRILVKIGSRPATLEEVTRGIFERRKLIGGNLYMALSEMVSHIELLQDTGDVELTEDLRIRGTGSENYRQLIHDIMRP